MQTGSGKTYTMGTSLKDGFQNGLIPKAMNALFSKIDTLKHEIEFQIHVSFIEVQSCHLFFFLYVIFRQTHVAFSDNPACYESSNVLTSDGVTDINVILFEDS